MTPFAPVTESTTPCAKTLVAAKAMRRIADEYCMLAVGCEFVCGKKKSKAGK